MIDFSIINYCETGTPASQRGLRSWMKHLSELIHSFDLVRSRPLELEISGVPERVVASAFGVRGEDAALYFADARELADPGYGEPIRLDLTIGLEAGAYEVHAMSPTSGGCSPSLYIPGGSQVPLRLPPFTHDLVVRISRARGDS